MNKLYTSITIFSCITLIGCATVQGPRTAQEKNISINGKPVTVAGLYYEKKNRLEITVNGDPIMRGKFLPYTPKKIINGKFDGKTITSNCYFGSVLGGKGGLFGAIAGAVQSAKSTSSDKCDISIDGGEVVETLYF
jgi:hypothetical protein